MRRNRLASLAVVQRIVFASMQMLLSLAAVEQFGAAAAAPFFVFLSATRLGASVIEWGAYDHLVATAAGAEPETRAGQSSLLVIRTVVFALIAIPVMLLLYPLFDDSTDVGWLVAALAAGAFAVTRVGASKLIVERRPLESQVIEFAGAPVAALAYWLVAPSPTVGGLAVSYAVGLGISAGVGLAMGEPLGRSGLRGIAASAQRSTPEASALLLGVALFTVPQLILAVLAEPEAVSQFAVAQRLAAVPMIALASLGAVYSPRFASPASADEPDKRSLLNETRTISLVISVGFVLACVGAVAVLAQTSLTYLDGIALPLLILGLGQIANGASGTSDQYLIMTGRAKRNVIVLAASLSLIVIAMIALEPWLSAVTAAAVVASANAFRSAATWRMATAAEPGVRGGGIAGG